MKDELINSSSEEPHGRPSSKSSGKDSQQGSQLSANSTSEKQTSSAKLVTPVSGTEPVEPRNSNVPQQFVPHPIVTHMVPVNILNTANGKIPVRPVLYGNGGFGMHHAPYLPPNCIPPQPYLIQGQTAAAGMQWGQPVVQNAPPLAGQAGRQTPMAYYTMSNMCIPPYVCHPNMCQGNGAMQPMYRNIPVKVPPLPESMPVSERLKLKHRLSQNQHPLPRNTSGQSNSNERLDSDQKIGWPPAGNAGKDMISSNDILQQVCTISDVQTSMAGNTTTRVTSAECVYPDILLSAMTPPSSESEVRIACT
mgnify:CR=1 FL=1